MDEQQIIETEIEATRETLNLETAKIAWKDLEVYFASGNVISISSNLDLTEVALQITKDNAVSLKDMLDSGIRQNDKKVGLDTGSRLWLENLFLTFSTEYVLYSSCVALPTTSM